MPVHAVARRHTGLYSSSVSNRISVYRITRVGTNHPGWLGESYVKHVAESKMLEGGSWTAGGKLQGAPTSV